MDARGGGGREGRKVRVQGWEGGGRRVGDGGMEGCRVEGVHPAPHLLPARTQPLPVQTRHGASSVPRSVPGERFADSVTMWGNGSRWSMLLGGEGGVKGRVCGRPQGSGGGCVGLGEGMGEGSSSQVKGPGSVAGRWEWLMVLLCGENDGGWLMILDRVVVGVGRGGAIWRGRVGRG